MWFRTTLQIVGAVIVLTLVGGMLFADELNGDADEYRRLTLEYVQVRESASQVRKDRDRLKAACRALQSRDSDFLEKTLRQDFGYVRPNEAVIRFKQ